MTAGLATFAKVRALHDSTTSPGEKASAAARMQVLAGKVGMTVAEALSKLDTPSPPSPVQGGGFADFFDTPYFREQMARHERERAVRWREVLDEYGTEEAVFWPGAMEEALDAAVIRFGSDPGWNAYPLIDVPPAIVATVEAAWPMPATVRDAWVEFAFWDKLGHDREARGVGYGDPSPQVQIRCMLLEKILDAAPAVSLNDLRARMSWLDHLDNRDARENGARLATLRADIERMGQRIREQDAEPTAPPTHGRPDRAGETGPVSGVQSGQEQGCARPAPPSPASSGTSAEISAERPAPVQSEHADGMQDRHPTLSPCQATAEISAAGYSQSEYPSRRTNADKRRDVLALIGQGLTDREIARRAGVSPTTVGTIRKGQP